jgi:hypothetical protein
MAKIAINGLGRIGRAALKILLETPQLQLVAANDIGSLENIAYLLKYDTVYGRYAKTVTTENGNLLIGGQQIRFFNEKDPAQLPGASWASTSCWNAQATSPSGRISRTTVVRGVCDMFLLAPLTILTGVAMSPAVSGHFPRYTQLFGGRQSARSVLARGQPTLQHRGGDLADPSSVRVVRDMALCGGNERSSI